MKPNNQETQSDDTFQQNQDIQQLNVTSKNRELFTPTSSKKAWARIASEIKEVDPNDHSDWIQLPKENNSVATDDSIPDNALESSSNVQRGEDHFSKPKEQTSEEQNATIDKIPPTKDSYTQEIIETNKIEEDYETRSRNRTHSVWNRGEWTLKGQSEAPQNYHGRGNQEDRFGDQQRIERRYYNGKRQQERKNNFYDDQGGRSNTSFYRQNDYRANGDYRSAGRSNYRQDRLTGYIPTDSNERRQYSTPHQGYRNDNIRNANRRQDGQRNLSPNDRIGRFSERREYRRETNEYQQQFSNNTNSGYRINNDNGSAGRRIYQPGSNDSYQSWRRHDYISNGLINDRRRTRYARHENLEPTIGAIGKRGEPLSLAEELAAQRSKRVENERTGVVSETPTQNINNENINPQSSEKVSSSNVSYGDRTPLEILELEKMTMVELVAEARKQDLKTIDGERRRDLLNRVLRARIQKNGMMFGEGTLEILPDEFGFLRSSSASYLSCPDDIYISPSQIRRFGLRNGLVVSGQIRPPKERERYFALLRVESINGENPNALASKVHFDDLVVARPNKQLKLELLHTASNQNDSPGALSQQGENQRSLVNLRVIDLVTPIAYGQRALFICPPHSGRTVFIKNLALSVIQNNPEVFVFVLLIDKRPEEISEATQLLANTNSEVVGSTFDESPVRHIQIAEIVFEKAKRMVEYGRDVVIVLDSLTRLARAWNTDRFSSDPVYNNNYLDPISLQRPKKLFSSARQIDGEGSLTVLATARLEDDNSIDVAALNEFREVANTSVYLDRSLNEENASLSIDLAESFVRDVKDFVPEENYPKYLELREVIGKKNKNEAASFLGQKILESISNEELLKNI